MFSAAQMNAQNDFTDKSENEEKDRHGFILSTESIFRNVNPPLEIPSAGLTATGENNSSSLLFGSSSKSEVDGLQCDMIMRVQVEVFCRVGTG